MTWLVGQMFALCLLSFLTGSVLTGLLLVRPSLNRMRRTALPAAGGHRIRAQLLPAPAEPAEQGTVERREKAERLDQPAPDDGTARGRNPDAPRVLTGAELVQLRPVIVFASESGERGPTDTGLPLLGSIHLGGANGDGVERRNGHGAVLPAWFTGQAEDDPGAAAEPGPYPGSVLPVRGGDAPHEEFTVKGNTRSMLYHTAKSPNFSRTKAQVWFRSAEDAEKAGFTSWDSRIRSN